MPEFKRWHPMQTARECLWSGGNWRRIRGLSRWQFVVYNFNDRTRKLRLQNRANCVLACNKIRTLSARCYPSLFFFFFFFGADIIQSWIIHLHFSILVTNKSASTTCIWSHFLGRFDEGLMRRNEPQSVGQAAVLLSLLLVSWRMWPQVGTWHIPQQ